VLFLAEFAKKQQRELYRSRLKQPNVEELICVGIDRSVRPVTLAVDANHCFVNRQSDLARRHCQTVDRPSGLDRESRFSSARH
jgi:hypothetical protein